MLERIRASDAPILVLLQYLRDQAQPDARWCIKRLVAIHPVFLTDAVIEARKPLSDTARRAGWQGCNLRIDRIPPDGHIVLIEDGKAVEPSAARLLYQSSRRFSEIDPNARGWTTLVLNIVRRIGSPRFHLREVYAHKRILEEAFPRNNNVEAKIRQQLQILRDLGYLRFSARGEYEVIG